MQRAMTVFGPYLTPFQYDLLKEELLNGQPEQVWIDLTSYEKLAHAFADGYRYIDALHRCHNNHYFPTLCTLYHLYHTPHEIFVILWEVNQAKRIIDTLQKIHLCHVFENSCPTNSIDPYWKV